MRNLEMDFKDIAKKITKTKRTYKLIFIVGLNILFFGLLYLLVITPQLETKKQLHDDYAKIKKDLDHMTAIQNNMQKYHQEYMQLHELLQQTLKQLPETKDIPNLLRSVSNIGSETRLKLTYFEPRAPQNKEYYAELPFIIRYSGPFHHIGYFFDGIRKLDRIINVSNFSLMTDTRAIPARMVLNGECTAKTYVYLKEQPKQIKKDVKTSGKGEEPARK